MKVIFLRLFVLTAVSVFVSLATGGILVGIVMGAIAGITEPYRYMLLHSAVICLIGLSFYGLFFYSSPLERSIVLGWTAISFLLTHFLVAKFCFQDEEIEENPAC